MVGPIAPERNPPINPQYYEPSRFVISDIVVGTNGGDFSITGATQTNPCVLTCNGNFDEGDVIKITNVVGMTQLNNNDYSVISSSSTSVSIDIDATGFTAYVSGGVAFRYIIPEFDILSSDQILVTTTEDTNYVVGQLVRLLIPNGYGSTQLSNRSAYVAVIQNPNQVILNISSINVSQFIPSPSNVRNVPQILAIGDGNTGNINMEGRINQSTSIPGSFINISPL